MNTAEFGPSDSFFKISGLVPAITTNATANSVTFNFGSFDDLQDRPSTTDILFTVQASDQPFADRLFLTNEAHESEGSTTGGSATADAIQQIQVLEPNDVISKGVVSTNDPNAKFSPGTVGPVPFTAPGQTGPAFTGTITSAEGERRAATNVPDVSCHTQEEKWLTRTVNSDGCRFEKVAPELGRGRSERSHHTG